MTELKRDDNYRWTGDAVQAIAQQIDALAMTAGQIGAASEDVANSATSLAQMGLRK